MATEKQKTAFAKSLENGGNITEAMKEAKYSSATIHNPKNLTDSKGWQQLVEKFLPDGLLLRVHKEGLTARRKRAEITDRDDKGRPIYEYFDEDDHPTRHRFLDSAYKIKGRLAGAEPSMTQNNIFIFDGDQRSRIARRVIARIAGSQGEPSSVPNSDQPEVRPQLAS